MKRLIFFFLSILSLNINAQNGFVFIELFTSQGDETCPVAEEILYRNVTQEIKNGANIFVLEYHVDYWNRLGWKDPFSKFQFSRRQENYSRVLAEKELYTPEVVINGKVSFSGTKELSLKEEIIKASAQSSKGFLSMKKDSLANDTLYLTYTTTQASQNAVFRFAITESGLTTNVSAGENSNKSLMNNYVVRLLHSVDGVQESAQVKIPMNGLLLNSEMKLIGFIQRKQSMEIFGVCEVK